MLAPLILRYLVHLLIFFLVLNYRSWDIQSWDLSWQESLKQISVLFIVLDLPPGQVLHPIRQGVHLRQGQKEYPEFGKLEHLLTIGSEGFWAWISLSLDC